MERVYQEIQNHGAALAEASERVMRCLLNRDRSIQSNREERRVLLDGLPPMPTHLGDAREVLLRGPVSNDEKILANALATLAALRRTNEVNATTRDLLTLAAETPFDAFPLLPVALAGRDEPYLEALQALVETPGLPRGQALVARTILTQRSEKRQRIASATVDAPHASDQAAESLADDATAHLNGPTLAPSTGVCVVGALEYRRLGPTSTFLSVVTGWAILRTVSEQLLRNVCGYTRRGTLRYQSDGLILTETIEIFGRRVRERSFEILAPTRIGIERSYPAVASYAAAVAFLFGSAAGLLLVTDGLRGGSLSLLALGLALVASAIATDYATSFYLRPGSERIRVLLEYGTRELRLVQVSCGAFTDLRDAIRLDHTAARTATESGSPTQ
jgi:hypothetical protein